MKSFGITDKGKVRAENQDSYIIENCSRRKCVVAVICDGMGGAKAGDLASRLSCKEFVGRIYDALISSQYFAENNEKLLLESCADANGVVYEYSGFEPDYKGMGTTLVGGIITRKKVQLVNVGDSRAYKLSGSGITQITRDHSYVEELVAMGAITKADARKHPKKNVITRALGVEPTVKADYYEVSLGRGDCILLCSDGLSNMVSDIEMFSAYKSAKTPEQLCRELVDLALSRGARDNVSVVAVKN